MNDSSLLDQGFINVRVFHHYALVSIISRQSEIIAKGFKNLLIETLKCKLLPYCMLEYISPFLPISIGYVGHLASLPTPIGNQRLYKLQFLNYLIFSISPSDAKTVKTINT